MGAQSVFMRLLCQQVPQEGRSKVQSVMQNVIALSGVTVPVWLSWTYAESGSAASGPPWKSNVGLGCLWLCVLMFVLIFRQGIIPQQQRDVNGISLQQSLARDNNAPRAEATLRC